MRTILKEQWVSALGHPGSNDRRRPRPATYTPQPTARLRFFATQTAAACQDVGRLCPDRHSVPELISSLILPGLIIRWEEKTTTTQAIISTCQIIPRLTSRCIFSTAV